ncbi:MAG: septum formation protein Maf [Deltaproteobacteria bacterium]|nr:septum formation protein Maf [Deltaproteobacteria bacterium]
MGESFILASLSPRRWELLSNLGISFEVVPSEVDETFRSGESPVNHALRLAREKALAVVRRFPHTWVLGADTIVHIDGEVLGKPDSPGAAREMLRKLSGREHMVITAFALIHGTEGIAVNRAIESSVLFKELSRDEIEWYIATNEPYDKAGSYAVQGKAAFFIKEIRGSHTNVIGLPLSEVVAALEERSLVAFGPEQS